MPIIKVGANRVAADDPGPNDSHVRVVWFGPGDEGSKYRKVFEGPIGSIEDYDAALAWAIELAPQMTYPIYVVPMSGVDVLRTEQMQRAMADLTDQERGELRQHIVATLARIMRDCDDRTVRADAHEILIQMKVIK